MTPYTLVPNPVPAYVQEAPVGYCAGEALYRSYSDAPLYHDAGVHKPFGYPVLPYPKDKTPPANSPSSITLGRWITVNAGYGYPPVWGFLMKDVGLKDFVSPKEISGTGPSTQAQQPGSEGHYVSVHVPGTDPFEESWVWIPEINSSFGK